ncbi:MAG TPA: hypothetical protein VMT75_03965 [Candidatus Saccharimonadales bacterium]|nr:hypothetical protein [Candidatus Saccharimonadales bacterium]
MKRLMQCSLLAVSLIAAAAPALGKVVPGEEVGLTVCLMNDAGVPAALEEELERRVDALMEDAAIRIRWLNGRDPGRTAETRCVCSHPEPMRVLILHLMATGKVALPSELGQAFLGEDGLGVTADLFLDRVERLTGERELDLRRLLAHVAAHELGHLLLGVNAHTVAGLMQARMDGESLARVEQGRLRFSVAQMKKMHDRVNAAGQLVSPIHTAASCGENGLTRSPLNQTDAM